MRKRRMRQEEDSAIDMTPMLDIVFIMLIFFIVTATFVKESGLDVTRPEAETAVKQSRVGIWPPCAPILSDCMQKTRKEARLFRPIKRLKPACWWKLWTKCDLPVSAPSPLQRKKNERILVTALDKRSRFGGADHTRPISHHEGADYRP